MSIKARPVVLATITGTLVALSPIGNGAGLSPIDVRDLARRAGADPQGTPRATFVRLARLPDVEAYCESRGIVVQRRGATT